MTMDDARETLVRDLMTPDPITVGEDQALAHAVHLMEEHEISGLPVVDSDGVLVGLLTQSDVVRARSTEDLALRWSELAVHSLMATPAITASPSMTVGEASRLMEARHIHRLIVVDDDQLRPVGVLSMTDLVRQMSQETADV
jgi:CBS domain-containing protein